MTHNAVECAPDRAICPHGKVNLSVARSVSLPPSATPTRTRRHASAADNDSRNHNSWERGIAYEERPGGFKMPYLGENGEPVGIKEFAQRRNTGAWDHPGKQVSSPSAVAS